MTITIDFERSRHVRITDASIDLQPPDAVSGSVSGTLRLGEEVLASVAGTTLEPVRVAFAAGERTVPIDLREEASLRLDAVDVGLEVPSADAVVPGTGELGSTITGGTPDPADLVAERPGVLAFTAEGTISGVPTETLAALGDGAGTPSPESVTFEPETPIRADGGRPDAIFETTLLGFGVVVYRDGRLSIGPRDATGDR